MQIDRTQSEPKIILEEILGADIGNTNIKIIWGLGEKERLLIPNVIAPADEERAYLKPENKAEQGLHVKVISKNILISEVMTVGHLAAKAKEKVEVEPGTFKSTSSQHHAALLTAAALRVALKAKNIHGDIRGLDIQAKIYLGISLPVQEGKKKSTRNKYKERILGTHHIEFLLTPELEGVQVELNFAEVTVGIEGVSAALALAANSKEKESDEASNPNHNTLENILETATTLVADLGGGSWDFPIISPDEGVDNDFTTGDNRIGTNLYLDGIIEDAAHEGVFFRSREELNQHLKNGVDEKAFEVRSGGRAKNIKHIVDNHLGKMAKHVMTKIEGKLLKRPDIEACFILGGGAILVPTYLEKHKDNTEELQLEIHYAKPAETSIWLNALGNYLAAKEKFSHLINSVIHEPSDQYE